MIAVLDLKLDRSFYCVALVALHPFFGSINSVFDNVFLFDDDVATLFCYRFLRIVLLLSYFSTALLFLCIILENLSYAANFCTNGLYITIDLLQIVCLRFGLKVNN